MTKWVDCNGISVRPSWYSWQAVLTDGERAFSVPCLQADVKCEECDAGDCGELAFEVD